jgi:hypothetical protein
MLYFFWIAFTVVVAVAAHHRNRSAFLWGLGAAAFSPLVAGVLLFVIPPGEKAAERTGFDSRLPQDSFRRGDPTGEALRGFRETNKRR